MRCTKDDVVLITGVGGGVQTFVLLFAKAIGARTIVTSSSDAKLARATALGADVAINYKTNENWPKEARAQSGGGPTLVVDASGGETLGKALDIARPGARVVVYGGTNGDAKIRPCSVFWKHLDILGTSMGSPADFTAMLDLFEKAARTGNRRSRPAGRRARRRPTRPRRRTVRQSRDPRQRLDRFVGADHRRDCAKRPR